jgi:hypothetical protein
VQLLRGGAALFPDGRVPTERARRQELVDSGEVPEGKLSALDERWFQAEERQPLDDYLAAYIRDHPDEFSAGTSRPELRRCPELALARRR